MMTYCLTARNARFGDHRTKTGKNPVIVVKKTHNVKNSLLCKAQKRILWLSRTFDGSVHDKKITGEHPLRLPSGITLWQDTGFWDTIPGM
ncbi:MAG: transposase family protein [Prevotellaceae bacterium]|nr:transposase family protein [Prevotellaceae bacterium]